MNAQYSVQFQDKCDPKKPMREQIFDNFSMLYAFVSSFDDATSPEAIKVHLPWHSTDREREQIASLDYAPS